jgi:hypothetical protein
MQLNSNMSLVRSHIQRLHARASTRPNAAPNTEATAEYNLH